MTLILKLDLDIVKMYHHTKNEVSMSTASKVIAQTDTHTQIDTQTDRHTHTHTDTMKTLPLPHTREVNMMNTFLSSGCSHSSQLTKYLQRQAIINTDFVFFGLRGLSGTSLRGIRSCSSASGVLMGSSNILSRSSPVGGSG